MGIFVICVVLWFMLVIYKLGHIRGYNLGQRYETFSIDDSMSWEEAVHKAELKNSLVLEVAE